MPANSFTTLSYSVNDGIAHIIFDKPPLNLIDEELTLEYHAALRQAESDGTAKVIVVSGKGKGLSGGLDIKFVESFEQSEMKDFRRSKNMKYSIFASSLCQPNK